MVRADDQERQRLLSFDSETVVAAGPTASVSSGVGEPLTAEEMIRQAIFKFGKPTSVVPVTAADLEGVDGDFQTGLVVQIQQRTNQQQPSQQYHSSDMNPLMAAYQQQQLMKLYRQQQQQQQLAAAAKKALAESAGNSKQGGLLGAIEGAILGAELGSSGYGNGGNGGYYPTQQQGGYYPGAYQPGIYVYE